MADSDNVVDEFAGHMTLEEFHDRIQFNSDEREDIQKKTFTKWINSHLSKHEKQGVEDLFRDFCTGKSLLALLEILSGIPLHPERGRMRVHHLNNVNRAVQYLTDKCNIRLVNISSDDIVNGNPKLILGLVWSIIYHWQVKKAMATVRAGASAPSGSEEGFEKTLLTWCKSTTEGYPKVNIQNFTSSWSDGFAFNALIHSHKPELFDYNELVAVNDPEYTLLHAFHIANSNLKIAKLLDPEDMVRPDKKSVLVYLTCLYEVLSPEKPANHNASTDTSTNEMQAHQPMPIIPQTNQEASATAQSTNQILTSTINQPTVTTSSLNLPADKTHVKPNARDGPKSPQVPNKVARLSAHAPDQSRLSPSDIASGPDAHSDTTTVTTASGVSSLPDLQSFNTLLEQALTWLLDAKDRFNKTSPVAEEVEIVKAQFHEHEKYMMDLTQYQTTVGSLLTKGNTLLQAGDLNVQQEQEVRGQVDLLNQEWEDLRVGAMERQTSLQKSLMELQQDQLTELGSWLTDMESKITSFNNSVQNIETLENVRKCVEEHQRLQEALETQQEKVNSLQNMVVIVEEGVQDNAYQTMEQQLEDLGSRWIAVCKWIEEQWLHLQDVDVKWRSYHTNADLFSAWLDNQEVLLGRMRLSDVSDPQILLNQVQKLKAIEGEMDEQMGRYDELNMVGQALISYLPSFPQTTEKIQLRLEEYKNRWDQLVQQMEQQSKVIAESGLNPEEILAAANKHKSDITAEFDDGINRLTEWLDKTETTLNLQESEDNNLSMDEQLVLLEDACEEHSHMQPNVGRLQYLTDNQSSELSDRRIEDHNTAVERWNNISVICQEKREIVDIKIQQRKFFDEEMALREILKSYSKWIDSAPDVTGDTIELGKQCEQCRVKLKAMGHQEDRLDKLYSSRHGKAVISDRHLSDNITKLYTDWSDVKYRLESRMQGLSGQLTQAPPRKYLDATEALMKWLTEAEDILLENVFITDITSMEKNVTLYQDLQKAIVDHVSDVEYVNKTGEDLVKRSSATSSSSEQTNALQLQLSSLNARWKTISDSIQHKLVQLAEGIEQLKLFEAKVNGLSRWMSDMEHFLAAEQPAFGDSDVLTAQIAQSDGALADIETLQSVVDEINTTGEILVSGSEEEFGVELKRELDKMNERWVEINKISQKQNQLLKEALSKSSRLLETISSFSEFLTSFDAQISEKLSFITKQDLDTSCDKIKKLENEIEVRKPQLEMIHTLSDELMEKSRQDSLPRLLNRLKHIDLKFKHVSERLSAKQEECSEVSTRYSDFLSLVQSEQTFISQLEIKLNSEDNQAVDAEDMAAEMDELETLLADQDAQSSQALLQLSNWFEENNMLVDETRLVRDEVDMKRTATVDKATNRVTTLDRASQKSQDTELRLSEMDTWMDEVNSLFREWTDQDLLAGDLPQDYKTLKDEFDEKDQFLNSIQVQISDFRTLGKTQAADRLEKKLELIKEDYKIAQQNFLKWQRPVDFDPKMRRTQQQLHEIDNRIYLIEIYSEDPEHVTIRLEQCAKFYTTMSEIKSEVEYVIKTGRQLVEKKQVDFPRRVNQSLDALKSLYNRLGSQISQARKDLDKALKISKVIAKNVNKVRELIENTEEKLNSDIGNLEEEEEWVQEREAELERVHPTLSSISTLHAQFQEFAEETALDEAKENLETLKERWQTIIQNLAARRRQIQAQRSNSDADLEMFKVKAKQLLGQLQALRAMLDNPDQLQKLQAELVTLKTDVTYINTTGAEISSKGVKYREQIEPTINNINSAYNILTNQAQVEHEVIIPNLNVQQQQSVVVMDTRRPITEQDELSDLLIDLQSAMETSNNKYQVASKFAACEARQHEFSETERTQFLQFQTEWNTKRSSTVVRWQSYELHWAQMSLKLSQLEHKLDMASTDSDLLQEIVDEIARRQVEINALNEQAEELTEQDVPPIDQRLLQLNQRWVGIRSKVANFKPANVPAEEPSQPYNGTVVKVEQSPRTKQKYEYAVINKNRQNQGKITTVTADINVGVESSPDAMKHDMALDLQSPNTPINNNSLFVTSPGDFLPSPAKSSTPGSGIDVDDESLSLDDEMSASTASKRSTVVTDIDEAAKTASSDNLIKEDISINLQSAADTTSDDAQQDGVRTLLSRIGIIQQQLRNSGLEVDSYSHENFSSSEDFLKSVRVSMEALEQDVNKMQSSLKSPLSSQSQGHEECTDRLDSAWKHLTHTYSTLQSNFNEACSLWTQFHALLKVITAWLDGTDKSLKRTRDKSGELVIEQAKNIQKDLEEGMSQHQAIIHNLARTAIPLASKLQPADAQRITEKVAKVTNRWRETTTDIRARKPRLDSMSDAGKCLDVMDDLSFWLDETEIIITTAPNYTDEQSLRDALEKVKDRSNEVPYKKEALEFVSRSARDLWSLPELRPEDKEKIGRDMQRVSNKWQKIISNIDEREKHLESSLQTLHDLLFEMGKLNSELWQAIEDLSPNMTDESYNEISEMYPRNQPVSVETLGIWYREVLLLYKRHSVLVPADLESHFRQLNIRWSSVKERTLLTRTDSDSSIEETLATAVGVDDIFDEPRQSIFLEDSIHAQVVDHVQSEAQVSYNQSQFMEQQEDCPPPPPRRESLQQSPQARKQDLMSGQPLNREVTLTLLRDRLALLNRTVSNRRVEVTDISQIQDCEVKVNKLTEAVQVILRQLSLFPEADDQVSGLRTECTECQIRSISRGNELRQLLIDSHTYGDKMCEVDSWLCQLENKIEMRKREAIGDAVDVIDKQIQQHMALELEMKSWKDNYAILNRMTEELLSNYPNEDHTNLRLNNEALSVRWNSIRLYISEHGEVLNTHKTLKEDYNAALDHFLSWLANQESAADILMQEINQNDPMRSSTWALRFKDLQSQIDSHQKQHEFLSLAGKRMIDKGENSPTSPTGSNTLPGAEGAVDTQAIKQRLYDMNERWSQLRAKTVQIRCRLESSMDQWSDLIDKIRSLIDYLTSRENELIAARPVAGNIQGLRAQQAAHQEWKSRLDSKTADFEHAISTGRFYLEREGADRRLSSASCDSRITDELTIESSEAKTVIKNIRRHIRLLNQKWLDLHNKSDRWHNQLCVCEKNLDAITNLVSLASRHINEIDNNKQAWKNVNDYPVSDLPRQLTSARTMRRRNEEVTEVLTKTNAIIKDHEETEGPVDNSIKQDISHLSRRMAENISDVVFMLIQQKRQLAQKAVRTGIYKTLDLAEKAHNKHLNLCPEEEEGRRSIIIRRGSVISGGLVDFRGEEFKPFTDDTPYSSTLPRAARAFQRPLRQREFEGDISQRVSELVSLNRSLVPNIDDLLKDSVSRPYERATTPAGVPYYINHDRKTTQWDHPRMVNLLAQLPTFNSTKFSAYRTAQKLRKMQKALGLNLIRLKDVIRCCQEQRVVSSVGDELIDVSSIISCLRDLFEHLADDRHASGINVPLSIDLSLNWLLNVYDLARQGQVRSLSFQVGLVIMCRGAVEDKFNYLLTCLADKQGLIDDSKLSILLSNCIQIPRQLGELASFGGANIDPSVQSCLQQANGGNSVTARQFMDWLALEPQSMVWLPVYHRLATSESCRHQAKCSLCKTTPIIGLRYRCLRCFNFNLCQTCFFAGKKGKSHKLNHPMKEYYCASTSNDDMKDLSSPMRKKYSSGRYIKKHNPKGYLPLNKLGDGESTFSRESLLNMSESGTPVSSPPSIHLQYETGGSVSSHDATIQSHDISSNTLPRADDSDVHKDIQRYANTLDRLEKGNRNNGNSNMQHEMSMTLPTKPTKQSELHTKLPAEYSPQTTETKPITQTKDTTQRPVNGDLDNDEHKIIERYCSSLTETAASKTNGGYSSPETRVDISSSSPLKSPLQIVMSLEDNQKSELEAMIKDLEDENRNLQSEYQMLQAERDRQPAQPAVNGDRQAEMLAEAKLLRQHKGRLETRMKILEDHNKQLEAQLRRLRHLLQQPNEPATVHTSSPQASSANSPLRVKKLPPTYEKQTSENDSTGSLAGNPQRTPKLHGSIGELFQMAGQVGKAVGQLVSVVSDKSS